MKVKIIYNTNEPVDEFVCESVNYDVVRGYTIIEKIIDGKAWQHLIMNAKIMDLRVEGEIKKPTINKMFNNKIVNQYPNEHENTFRKCLDCGMSSRQKDMYCKYDGFSLESSKWYCQKCYIERCKND